MKASPFKAGRIYLFSLAAMALVALACLVSFAPATRADNTKGDGSAAATPPKVGDAAPDFALPYATQEQIYLKPEERMSLAANKGKNVILAFYPADWSGGCTKEVCTLRDTFAEL